MEEIKEIYETYTDVWKIHRKYHGIQQSEHERWENLQSDTDSVLTKHKGSMLAKKVALAMLEELEGASR